MTTKTLPNKCPIPNAQSSIIDRQKVEGFSRYYYNIRIVYDHDDSEVSQDEAGHREEVAQIEMSQILKYVSRRELERFEQEDYAQQAQAEEVARRAEAEELARRRLEKNARGLSMVNEETLLHGMPIGQTGLPARPRGRPRGSGRGRGRGRGRGFGRGGFAGLAVRGADLEGPDEHPIGQVAGESAMLDTSEEEETEAYGVDLSNQPSPGFALSSFVAKSALPLSPVAAHRRLSKSLLPSHMLPMQGLPTQAGFGSADDESGEGSDARSFSSAAAQLQFERDVYGQQLSGTDDESDEIDDADRHRMKRQRSQAATTARAQLHARPIPSAAKEPSASSASFANHHFDDSSDSDASELPTYKHSNLVQLSKGPRRATVEETPEPRHPAAHHDEDMEMQEDGSEEEEEEYVVEAILSHSYENGKKYYLVKWEGAEDSSDWLPEDDLAGASELVHAYNNRIARKKGKTAMH